jgi:ABC-type antimicrobial peptide transport system permease subunit
VIAVATLAIAGALMAEAVLSTVRRRAQLPMPNGGAMVSDRRNLLRVAP